MTTLSTEELEECRKTFLTFDLDGSGKIDVKELKAALKSLGQNLADEDLIAMIRSVDEDNSGQIEFYEFLKVIESTKSSKTKATDETDTLDAFVALGGQADKTGKINVDKLAAIVKDFELTIPIDRFIKEVDKDKCGFLDYETFRSILS